MAITSRAEYAMHMLAALKRALLEHPEAFPLLLPGLHTYGRTGADQREAIDIFLNHYQTVVLGQSFNGHRLNHLMLDVGIPAAQARDVPYKEEPLV